MGVGTDATLEAGQLLGGRYRLEEALATDPLVHVWRANDVELRRPVVCKVLHPRWMDDDDMVQRFRFGAYAAVRLDHENVARTYDVEDVDGYLYTVSEHVDGPDLGVLIASGTLGVEAVAAVGQQAAAGLGAAHELGLAHGGVCPQNLVVGSGGRLCVIDFGSVQFEHTAGTPGHEQALEPGIQEYWAPERLAGGAVETDADIYALGLVLWEALTGQAAVGTVATGEPEGIVRRTLQRLSGADDDLEPQLRALLRRATAADPASRPATSELVDGFVAIAGVRPHDHLAPLLAERDRTS